jgi:hypothetical protein
MFVHFKNYLQCTPTPPKKKLNKYNHIRVVIDLPGDVMVGNIKIIDQDEHVSSQQDTID